MNAAAKAHLAKAKEYVDRGEQFYRMAAEQILAARGEGSAWTEINDGARTSAKRYGHEETWAIAKSCASANPCKWGGGRAVGCHVWRAEHKTVARTRQGTVAPREARDRRRTHPRRAADTCPQT